MPVQLTTDKEGHLFLHKTCEECGKDATLGYGVNLRAALIRHEAGDKDGYAARLGRWYCGECKPK